MFHERIGYPSTPESLPLESFSKSDFCNRLHAFDLHYMLFGDDFYSPLDLTEAFQ